MIDLAHVVDAGMGGGVDLEHVDVAALGDLDAGVAARRTASAWGPRTQLRARARMRAVVVLPQPRGPANTNAWAMPLALQGVAQRAGDGLLAQHVVERLGPPLPRERLVGHPGFGDRGGWCGPHRSPEVLQHISGAAERCCLPALTRFAD